MPPEFNIDQQAFLEQRQIGKAWTWSALRPSVLIGFGLGNPMNLAMVIAIYASMSRELGLPLRFPGKPGAYDSLLEMTDAGLLARATIWAATTAECANQALKITNGAMPDRNRLPDKIRIVALFHRRIERVHVDVDDLANGHELQPNIATGWSKTATIPVSMMVSSTKSASSFACSNPRHFVAIDSITGSLHCDQIISWQRHGPSPMRS